MGDYEIKYNTYGTPIGGKTHVLQIGKKIHLWVYKNIFLLMW